MKPKREKFRNIDDEWIHTEVLGHGKKRSDLWSNCIVGIVLVAAIVLLVLAFQGMFRKQDLSNLENLDNLVTEKADTENADKPKEEVVEDLVYTVESGDTLAGVGEKFAVTWQSIAERNGLTEPYALEVGQQLTIPGVKKAPKAEEPAAGETTAPAVSGGTYTVKPGDTLAGIGLTLDIAWEQIAKLNNIEPPYALEVDQVLTLPAKQS